MAPTGSANVTTRKRGEITGRTVLLCLLAFFGVVMTVNFTMARLAVSTFGGVETENAYKAGLAFGQAIDKAHRQDALGWKVQVDVADLGAGLRRITVKAVDAQGNPLSALGGDAHFFHPTDARLDHQADLTALGEGRYRVDVMASAGQWDLIVDLTQGGAEVFRSKNRILLR